MMKRMISSIGLFLVLGVLLAGCGNEPEQAQEEFVYVPSFYEYETKANWVNSAVSYDGKLLVVEEGYFNRPYSTLLKINVDTGEREEFDIGLSESRYIGDILETEDGYVVFSEEYIRDKSEAGYEKYDWNGAYLTYYDESFTFINETDITDFAATKSGFSQFYYTDAAADDEGNVYFYFKETIYVVGRDGKIIAEIKADAGEILDMELAAGQVFLAYTDPGNQSQVAPVDIKNNCIGSTLSNVPDSGYWAKLFSGKEEELYLSTADYLWKYDSSTGEWTEELKWLDVDMDGLGLHHCLYMNGMIVTLEYASLSYDVTFLKKLPASQVKEKEILTVTMLRKDYYLLGQVTDFNRKSQEIRLESKYYVEEEFPSPEALEKGIQEFQLDLISGDLGDIIFVSAEMDYNNLASKGTFANLDDFLIKDPDVHKEDFIENLVDTLSVDGKLYGIVPTFFITTFVGKTSIVGDRMHWTTEDVISILAEHKDSLLLDNYSKSSALKLFLQYSMDSYYDITTGECWFDGEAFRNLLKVADTFPETIEYQGFQSSDYAKDKFLLIREYSPGPDTLYSYRALFGEDVTFIGYPTSTGSGNVAGVGNGVYTINASSEHKEAAWQFIREFLLEEYQNKIGITIPINKEAFENQLTLAMNKEINEKVSGSFYDIMLKDQQLSEEDAQTLRDMVYGVTRNNSYDYQMLNLILEEAESYFSGQKSIDEVVAIIQNRAQLYVDENK